MVIAPARRITPVSCIAVADQRRARLFAITRVHGSGSVHLEELSCRENSLIPHDRGGAPVGTGVRSVSYADSDREHDVMRDQFAAEAVQWLADELRRRPTDGTLRLIAPPEFLGALRRALSTRPLPARITEHVADLAGLTIAELEHHAAIIDHWRTTA